MEFDTPDALRNYLKEHPNADKSKHTVLERAEEAVEKEEGILAGMAKSRWNAFKAVGKGVINFIKKSPEVVKKFVVDKEYRDAATTHAALAIQNAPTKVIEAAVNKAKREAKDYGTAIKTFGRILKGEKPSNEEKRVLAEVATGLAFTIAGVALTGGLAGGAKAFASGVAQSFATGVAKKLALVTVTDALGDYPTLLDMHDTFSGASDLLSKLASEKGSTSDEDFFAAVLTKKIAERLKAGLDDQFVAEAIAEMDED